MTPEEHHEKIRNEKDQLKSQLLALLDKYQVEDEVAAQEIHTLYLKLCHLDPGHNYHDIGTHRIGWVWDAETFARSFYIDGFYPRSVPPAYPDEDAGIFFGICIMISIVALVVCIAAGICGYHIL